jgi:hypothetical protein
VENDISDFVKKYNVKLVMPSNADGWKCDWKNCGWCCVTEMTDYHNKNKCSNFDIKKKECRIYKNRLVDCKIYPFMIITTNDGIVLSPSLNCPYVLSSIKMAPLVIEDILVEKQVRDQIWSFSDIHRKVLSKLNILYTNTDFNNTQQTNDLLKSLTCIKQLEDLKKFIFNYYPFDIMESIKRYSKPGSYIKPNYSPDGIPTPIFMNIRVTKKDHIFFKNNNINIIKEIIVPENISFNDKAQITFKQYIELNINRHLEFSSLFIRQIQDPDSNPKNAYMETWILILYLLYTHLILIALREKVYVVDYPMMREALSITDSCLHGLILIKPNIPKYQYSSSKETSNNLYLNSIS